MATHITTPYLPADGEVGWGQEIRDNFTDIEAFVNALADDLEDANTNIATIVTNISDIYSTLTDYGSRISGLETANDGLTADLLSLEAEVSGRIAPTGTVWLWAGNGTVPDGWVECDGTQYDSTNPTYSALYGAIGDAFNAGASGGYFNVPNFAARFPVGIGIGSGPLSSVALGSTGGEAEHVLVTTEIPPHTHNFQYGSYAATSNYTSALTEYIGLYDALGAPLIFNGSGNSGTTDSGSVGDGSGNTIAHNNCPPFLGIRFIIKL